MMNKRLNILLGLLLLVSLLGLAVSNSFAQSGDTALPTPELTASTDGQVDVDLARLGYPERNLKGPFATATYHFGLPAHWQPAAGTQFQLDIEVWGLASLHPTTATTRATLAVYLNDVRLDTVALTEDGQRSLTLNVPTAAFALPQEDGRHRLRVILEDDAACNSDFASNIRIKSTSRLVLPYQTIPFTPELSQLPYPLFQRSFLPEGALIVVPVSPSASELQAALTVAAGFGRMTQGELALTLISEDQLTPNLQQTYHLILVGKSDSLALAKEISFPEVSTEQSMAQADDGLIQIAVSPWNNAKAALWLSGASDAGVLKAGQAAAGGVIRGAGRPDVAVVRQVNPNALRLPGDAIDQTLAELGYQLETLVGAGHSSTEFVFPMPAGQAPAEGVYFDLVFAHSTLIDYQKSGVGINVNGEPVGSVRLSNDTASLSSTRISIPRTAIHSGVNRLTVDGWFEPASPCYQFENEGIWLAVRPESTLHLPRTDVAGTPTSSYTLANFPAPFSQNFNLDDTAFVLPTADPAAWQVAAQLAFSLGAETRAQLPSLTVALDDLAAVTTDHHVLLVGQPQKLAAVTALADSLPVSYTPDTNDMNEANLPFVYHVPPEVSVGVLQLLPAPENPRQTIVAVLGNSAEGLQLAAGTLLDPNQRAKLAGNVAVVDNTQLLIANTGSAPVGQPLLTDQPAESPAAAPVSLAPASQPMPDFTIDRNLTVGQFNTWMLPVIAVSIAAMIFIAGYVSFAEMRKRRVHSR